MVTLDFKALTSPVGIVRILQVLFTCVTFSVVAVYGNASFYGWCMLLWIICFCITIIIIILEFFSARCLMPTFWQNFTAVYAMVATLVVLAASIIFSVAFVCSNCGGLIGASVTSFITFILYGVEVRLTLAKARKLSSFLTTVPGLLKVLETCVAYIIFSCLWFFNFSGFRYDAWTLWLLWCVIVYYLCFSFTILCVIYSLGVKTPVFDKVLCCCNIVVVLAYFTAMVIWPYYTLMGNPRPPHCSEETVCVWDIFVVVTFLTSANLIVYIIDTVYSFRLFFFVRETNPAAGGDSYTQCPQTESAV